MDQLPEAGFLRLQQIIGQEAVSEEQAAANNRDDKSPKRTRKCTSKRKSWNKPKRPRPYIPPVIPVKKSTWWAGVKSGRYPKPIKLGPNVTAWRIEDIRALIERLGVSAGLAK